MLNLDKFKTTRTAVEGRWFELEGGARVKLAKHNNPIFRRKLRDYMQKDRKKSRLQDGEFLDECNRRAFSEAIWLDCENLEHPDIGTVEYNSGLGYDIITEYPEFFDILQELSVSSEFPDDEEELEEASKN